MRRALAVGIAAAMLLVAGVLDRAYTLDAERADAQAELVALSQAADAADGRTLHLEGSVERAEQDAADRAAVLEVRPAFIDAVAAFDAALQRAEGIIDTTAPRASVVSAQESVRVERVDPTVVTNATASVQALTVSVDAQVAQRDSAQRIDSAAQPGAESGGAQGFERVRQALDQVGGSGVGLYESSSCAGGEAPACANSEGYIKYRADIASWSMPRLQWAMAHELAHIHQFRVWGALNAAPAYASLFGSDPEFLANCMALVRGYPGSQGCGPEQQAWASAIWVGAVQ